MWNVEEQMDVWRTGCLRIEFSRGVATDWVAAVWSRKVQIVATQESERHVEMFEQCGWTVEALVVEAWGGRGMWGFRRCAWDTSASGGGRASVVGGQCGSDGGSVRTPCRQCVADCGRETPAGRVPGHSPPVPFPGRPTVKAGASSIVLGILTASGVRWYLNRGAWKTVLGLSKLEVQVTNRRGIAVRFRNIPM